jgi:hypothetical protein
MSRISRISTMNSQKIAVANSDHSKNRFHARVLWASFLISLCVAQTNCAGPHVVHTGRLGFFDRGADTVDHHGPSEPVFTTVGHKVHETPKRAPLLKRAGPQKYAVIQHSRGQGVGGLMWPLQWVSVTSDYGKRGKIFHEGIDLKAPTGTPVYAAQSGHVIYSGSQIPGYGKMVVLKHDNGIATVYAHNSSLLVRRGDRVIQGQRISMSGASGHARGPHLHFETRRGVVALDPIQLLPRGESRQVASR